MMFEQSFETSKHVPKSEKRCCVFNVDKTQTVLISILC